MTTLVELLKSLCLICRHATVLEGALKIKEISYMHSEGKLALVRDNYFTNVMHGFL
jgi:glucosamine 6-phosphate synthetase-like amidotransferase/phosphosugar isomerase protein